MWREKNCLQVNNSGFSCYKMTILRAPSPNMATSHLAHLVQDRMLSKVGGGEARQLA